MNTERPDNDDAEARAFGSARDTGGASADGADTPRGARPRDAAAPGPAPEAPAAGEQGEGTGDTGAEGGGAPEGEHEGAPEAAESRTTPGRPEDTTTGMTAGAATGDAGGGGPESGSTAAPRGRGEQPAPEDPAPEAPPAGDAQAGSSSADASAASTPSAPSAPKPVDTDAGVPRAESGAPRADVSGTRAGESGSVRADAHASAASEDTDATAPEAPEADDAEVPTSDSAAAASGAAQAGEAGDQASKSTPGRPHGGGAGSPEAGTPATGGAQTDTAETDGGVDRAAGSGSVEDAPRGGAAVAEEPEAGSSATGVSGPDAPAPGGAAAGEHGTGTAGASPVGAAADDGPVPGADEGPAGVGHGAGATPAGVHGGDGHGAGRRRSPGLVAAVAAAVLLVGGGGAYLAASASGGPDGGGTTPGANGGGTPPPLALDAYAGGGTHGIAPGEPNPYGAAYRADGPLPDGPDAAPVYRTRGQVTEAQVAGLAEALGIDGKPVAEGEAWRIGGKDGSGPTLRVDRGAPGTWTFSRYTPGPDACTGKGGTCKAPSAGDAPAVSEEAAKRAAAPVLKALGQDDAKLDAGRVTGVKRVVNAEPEVGGLPTHGWTTGVVVGAGGEVVGGSGRLSTPVKADTYPVVGAEEALELLNTAPGAGGRAEIGGCATPVPLEDGDRQERQEPCVTVSPLPAKDTVVVEGAVFGLAAHAVDGQQALVPSWLFEVRPTDAQDGGTVTYPAVEPEYLAPRASSGESSTEPAKPGDGDRPTSSPTAREVAVEGYTAEGDELTVTFTGGVCADYEAAASESGGRVTVTVTETPWPDKVCILIAKQYQQTVRLDAPLGAREVVDADGEPVPLRKDGARLPAPPSKG
ncbi:hypothetical protein APS67_002017 [Streptomyces sp. AVP053U2]|nr:hypothetical protein APS67_002017 [Streptomyces sp. AVP053U2]